MTVYSPYNSPMRPAWTIEATIKAAAALTAQIERNDTETLKFCRQLTVEQLQELKIAADDVSSYAELALKEKAGTALEKTPMPAMRGSMKC